MWSGAWGLLDALVDLLAPEDVRARLLLYARVRVRVRARVRARIRVILP